MAIPTMNTQSITSTLSRTKHSPTPFSGGEDLTDDKSQGVFPSNSSSSGSTSSRPKRKRISPDQFQALSDIFDHTDTPNFELREQLALRLNMTNREVQVWFQNRRAKFNRVRQQELRKRQIILDNHHHHHHHHHQQRQQQDIDLSPKPNYWSSENPQDHPSYSDDTYSSTSTSSSPSFTPISSPYPAVSPEMTSLDILALAAKYVERCDQEQEAVVKRQKADNNTTTATIIPPSSPSITTPVPTTTTTTTTADNNNNNNTHKSWRPWL